LAAWVGGLGLPAGSNLSLRDAALSGAFRIWRSSMSCGLGLERSLGLGVSWVLSDTQQFYECMADDGGVIRRLFPQVQPYTWGSPTAMTEFLGIPSTGGPMAELWLGDHPLLPSLLATEPLPTERVTTGQLSTETNEARPGDPLDCILRENPSAWFHHALPASSASASASACASETLPTSSDAAVTSFSLRFLLKVMAIAEPLSLQTHPNKAQAEAGFAREDALGISRTAPNRNYRDPNHKPELICALTTMDALSGFRPAHETMELLACLDDASASLLINSLSQGLDVAMRDGLGGTIFAGPETTASFAQAARNAAIANPEHSLTFSWWAALCDRHPGDGGVAVATLLHCVRLEPGQALFLSAGNMHAYLSGVGIEIMASSDNVLRGGLTPKHVDIEELLRVTLAVAGPLPLVLPIDVTSQIFSTPANHTTRPGAPIDTGDGNSADAFSDTSTGVSTTGVPATGWLSEEWPVPVDDFRLLRLRGSSTQPCKARIEVRPLIALCTEGEVCFTQGADAILLKRGESAVIGNSETALSLSGSGTAFLASAG
jgi:mannose-6-phosphate isomerase